MFGKKKEQESGASLPDIHIVICSLKGGNYPVEVLEFDAIQEKDDNFNMFAISGKHNWKEELEQKKHHIIEYLLYKLNFSTDSKEAKLNAIDKKIREVEDKIREINNKKREETQMKDVVLQDDDNLLNLKNDLRHYQVLRFTVENEGNGSYEIINKAGKRELRFLAREGIFHPYFYRSDVDKGMPLTMYPDVSKGRKYYREIDDKVAERYLKAQDSNFFSGIKGLIITVGIFVLIVAFVMAFSNLGKERSEVFQKLDECKARCDVEAVKCTQYYSQLIEFELINRTVEPKQIEEQKKTTSGVVDITQNILGNS